MGKTRRRKKSSRKDLQNISHLNYQYLKSRHVNPTSSDMITHVKMKTTVFLLRNDAFQNVHRLHRRTAFLFSPRTCSGEQAGSFSAASSIPPFFSSPHLPHAVLLPSLLFFVPFGSIKLRPLCALFSRLGTAA